MFYHHFFTTKIVINYQYPKYSTIKLKNIWYFITNFAIFAENLGVMELRIKEICKAKGLRLADLAARIGTDQSNLNATLKGNPTLGKLTDIANALGVEVYDLFKKPKEESVGVINLNGQTFRISQPSVSVVQVPVYAKYDELRASIRGFAHKCIDREQDDAICGMVETLEYFTLSYDKEAKSFSLTLCYGVGQILSFRYSCDEFCHWEGEEQKWDEQDVIKEIINDLEGAVLSKLGIINE